MDDRFLHQLRREPRPEFARDLRARLRAQEVARPAFWATAPAMAAAAAVLLVVALFAFPSVRAYAQSVLDMFRVRQFAAVQFDESRLEKLRAMKQDNAALVFDRIEKLRDPGEPKAYTDLAAAEAAAGMSVRRLGHLPNGLKADTVLVEGAGEARLAVSESKLRALLDQLGLREVAVPPGLEGKWVGVRRSPVVIQHFQGGRWEAALAQGASPEVSVPAGYDVERLAEVGLRILGLDAGEARRMARATDWRSTLVVPVPLNASTFRQVTIQGQPGLLITTSRLPSKEGGRPRKDGTVVLWTANDRVFGLMTNLGPDDAAMMAESVR